MSFDPPDVTLAAIDFPHDRFRNAIHWDLYLRLLLFPSAYFDGPNTVQKFMQMYAGRRVMRLVGNDGEGLGEWLLLFCGIWIAPCMCAANLPWLQAHWPLDHLYMCMH